MQDRRFGEYLGQLVPLSRQDVAEILEEQAISHRRFGRIALSWGLCEPEHIWRAWCDQLAQRPQVVDLEAVGVDTQSVKQLTAPIAREYVVVPVRCLPDRLILATAPHTRDRAASELPAILNREIQFVITHPEQIESALRGYYPEPPPGRN